MLSNVAVIVQKYGGSSVADLNKIHQVAQQVALTKRGGHDVVVVVSAMGKTTQELLSLAERAATAGGGPRCEPPRRELDMLVSTGERVSMSLLSIAISSLGLESISFTGSQCGIITNDRHFDARIIEVRPHRIEDELARGRVVIVAGYQGMSYKREVTTLGRGGSDTTAVALAAALGAERCEIYSDVDGVYSADPRNIADAQHLPELSYDMLQTMAHSGAKVLNAQAVDWARRERVSLHARRTGDAIGGGAARETVVSNGAATDVRAVVLQPHVAMLKGPRVGVLEALDGCDVPLIDWHEAGGVRTLVGLKDAPSRDALLERLGASTGIQQEVGSLVSLIGNGVAERAADVADACRETEPPMLLLASPLRLAAFVSAERAGALEARWHERYVGQSDAS